MLFLLSRRYGLTLNNTFPVFKIPTPTCGLKKTITAECITKDWKHKIQLQRQKWLDVVLLFEKQEEEMLHILVKYGVRSGKTANLGLEVMDWPFTPTILTSYSGLEISPLPDVIRHRHITIT